MANTLIELKNITTPYEMQQSANCAGLQDINIRIQEGEFIAILGPSGSGKSKLLKMIAGLGHLSSAPLFPWLTVFELIVKILFNLCYSKGHIICVFSQHAV